MLSGFCDLGLCCVLPGVKECVMVESLGDWVWSSADTVIGRHSEQDKSLLLLSGGHMCVALICLKSALCHAGH